MVIVLLSERKYQTFLSQCETGSGKDFYRFIIFVKNCFLFVIFPNDISLVSDSSIVS